MPKIESSVNSRVRHPEDQLIGLDSEGTSKRPHGLNTRYLKRSLSSIGEAQAGSKQGVKTGSADPIASGASDWRLM